ncbi:MAG: hypothetical protein P1U38_04380 [Aeromicrobium sp.]|uniref:putative immunity protein n=1 Tax=Aeromicrobium sp. TaxID=1871063 RepID=UPI00262F6720|nr:hypothetical protein [Aeromicrobium sp.]MDF1703988.1 hypothetical protein [Aeromicrobium sp.]
MTSIQTLSDPDRRLLARWAAACAERVSPLVDGDAAAVGDVAHALARTFAYADGRSSAAEEIGRRLVAVRAASQVSTPAGAAAARAVGQASAVAHMGAHALGAAGYAVKAVALAAPDGAEAFAAEVQWQLDQLDEACRAALRLLPPLGSDRSGPLGPGLLAGGVVGSTIREIQAQVGSTPA